MESIELKEIFGVKPDVVYHAWLDSQQHSKMTGGKAVCSSQVNETYSAWDGYISGKNVELKPNQKIVQSWRTTEFSDKDEDSLLTIQLKEIKNGTEFILTHTNIPKGQTQYKKGWKEHYFDPMKVYFGRL